MSKLTTKVLVIDDKDSPLKAVKEAFESSGRRPFEVKTAKNTEEAEIAMEEVKFDVLVVDLMLSEAGGDEGGITLLKEAMVFAGCPTAVKIIITGYPTYERCVKALRAGAWDFIPKVGQWVEKTVESVANRLAELEQEAEQETYIFEEWLPKHEDMLQAKYPNKYVAILNGNVVAQGSSTTALGNALTQVPKLEDSKPFILFVDKRKDQ